VAREGGLTFRLSEGVEGPPPTARPPAASQPLSEAETRVLLERLPPLAADPEDEKDTALRESSRPPPRTGTAVKAPFPPPSGPKAPAAPAGEPLRVVRHAPVGDVPLAPSLSVTFSQPMVALTSHEELERAAAPVTLTPEPPGQWRWVGTRTLVFEPAGRFPMATTYTAEVAAGVRSATGNVLGAPVRWSFTTPAPRLTASYPRDAPARRDAVIVAAFDQKVDPQAVLATIAVRAGGAVLPARLATADEVEADPAVARIAAEAGEGRWLALRAVPLPADAAVTVTVGPGTPSAEGPRRTTEAQAWGFRTFGPLRVTGHECGWRKGECPPFTPWQIVFSNPIDAKAFHEEMVRVEPELPALKVDLYGDRMIVSGRATGRTAYRVTLAAALPDTFGQTLGQDRTVSFQVTAAPQGLSAPGNGFVVLDPAAGPRLSIWSVNHDALKVRVYAVGPADWPHFQKHMQAAWSNTAPATPPGRLVLSRTVPTEARPDEMAETRIDLSSALRDGLGQVVLVVEPASPPADKAPRQKVVTWAQATRIGLAAFAGSQTLTAWASSLADGRPLEGVEVELLPGGVKGATGPDGLVRLPLPARGAGVLVARRGNDVAVLPQNRYWWSSGSEWPKGEVRDELRFYVFDDRKMYRPGEEVKVKGWIRRIGLHEDGDIEPLADAADAVAYTLRDSQGNEVGKGAARVNAWGGFDLTLKLPPTMNLGDANLLLVAGAPPGPIGDAAKQHLHVFQVQEFRRPEFEVEARAGEGPHFVGGRADVTVAASYYAGGALSGADVSWRVAATPGSFTPPNRDDYTFGEWTPWWEVRLDRERERVETFAGRTGATGSHRLRIDFLAVDPPRATAVKAEATVMDVNRQAWTAAAALLVHPADLYVGLKSDRLFVQRGEPLRVQAIVTDLDGTAVAGRPVALRAERLEWTRADGEWKESPVDPQDCRAQSAAEAVTCRFETKEGGPYRVTARVTDDRGRPNETRLRLWVAGGSMPPSREVEQEKVTLIPDKKEYAAGETAEILVLAPFAPAEAVLSLRRSGIVRTERFTMPASSHTARVVIDEAWTPNVHVQVDLVGAAPRTNDAGEADPRLPKRPAFATGTLNLSIPPRPRTLALTARPRDKALEPGGRTVLDVELRDASGRPVEGAEVAVVVADEAVLSLTGYRLPDPLKVFYAERPAGGHPDSHLRASLVLDRPQDLAAEQEDKLSTLGFAGGVAGGVPSAVAESVMAQPSPAAPPPARKALRGRAEPPQPIRTRLDFSALALFAASLPTDAAGRAQVEVTLPDSLTRYRVMAVAATRGNAFGSGESTITARLPLMVRPSPPRFLNFGDRFELPVVVQNQTDEPLDVAVAVRARNAELAGTPGRRVSVPPNDRVEVRFPAAARNAGTARFQVGAAAGRWADAALVALPVWTPATTEAFATYGQIDEGGVVQPVVAPPDVLPQFGGLEVTTSSTALQALTDAVLYLAAYPFECAEQLSSRVMAVAALRDVLTAFRAEGLPEPDEMIAAVARDVERLRALQGDDGGFPFWRRGDPSWPYISIHVAHALQRAKEKGFAVPAPMLERSRAYLKGIDGRIPAEYRGEVRRTLVAYALYVRHRMGDADPARARALVREEGVSGLSFEAIGWILPVLAGDGASQAEAASLRSHLANRVAETAAAAHFVVDYGEQGPHVLLHSDRRADAVVLEALIADQPGSDLVPKLVAGLLAHRKAGRWANTQENAFVLLALDRYFGAYEKTTPDFVARVWLGERFGGEHAFRGRTTERHHLEVPMRALAEVPAAADLTLDKDGPGRLYYRLGLRYAPARLDLAPADHGFAVERSYEAVDDPADVRRQPDGSWRIRAGARVRVRITLAAEGRRYHAALVDPLPAGLEPMNPELATTGTIPGAPPDTVDTVGAPGLGRPGHPGSWWWWRRAWFDHQNMRDDRVEAFASLLWEGVYTYRYVARATTPGRFVVPPPRAEEMYAPETFGRGGTDRVVVE
jgi:uncharacterized protein YfaS (alpha-2-macroglobulin family)